MSNVLKNIRKVEKLNLKNKLIFNCLLILTQLNYPIYSISLAVRFFSLFDVIQFVDFPIDNYGLDYVGYKGKNMFLVLFLQVMVLASQKEKHVVKSWSNSALPVPNKLSLRLQFRYKLILATYFMNVLDLALN